MKKTQVAIIGAGPVGLFTAFYARLRGLDVTLIDSLENVGGQVNHLYPQKDILDVPGYVKIEGQALIDQLAAQTDQLHPNYLLQTTVEDVAYDAEKQVFMLQTNTESVQANRVILAIGHGAFEPKRLPDGIGAALEGQGVYYVVDDLDKFKDQTVLVAGGGDAAVDQALALAKVAKKVYLTHRRDRFRAMAYTLDQLAESPIERVTPYNITDIRKDAELGLEVTLTTAASETPKELNVDAVVINYGFKSDSQLYEQWSCQPTVARQRCVVEPTMQSSVPGLYAVGDIAGYANKTDLIATGFGEGTIAVNGILQDLEPALAGPLHSSGYVIQDGQVDPLQ
ncbi:NAD(P)/FAD-dependent oxidoreductase [Weissella viridescens]|uniref:Ferredoxin--NADP reductase n=1 Tax=Weissella viridescens TaxID=1629 RepID=A0A3P2RL23_WEIVI|nr:NAD(P)/FAD-dependent oxidoreductase [Weissella viridescens]RRG18148.1 NAD(P)/FAD-dependent oxidoreductase [Weissella viridescens]